MDIQALFRIRQGGAQGRRALAAALAAAALGYASAGVAQGTLSMIVATSPGTGVDILARAVGHQFSTKFGVTTVVENRPGASGNIGADHVARAKADGSTLLVAATTFATNAAINHSLPFDPVKSFEPVALLGTGTLCLVVAPNLQVNSLDEFIALAKSRPGAVNYASPGNGTPQHLAMELFKQEAGIDLFHVPFKGTGGALNDLSGGHVSAMIAPVHTVMTLVNGGKLKLLAVMSPERVDTLPAVPTFREQGYPKLQVDVWYGLLAPAGTPAAVVTRLNQHVNEALKNPEVLASLAKQGINAAGGEPQRMAQVLDAELKRWPPVVKAAQIKAD